MIDVSVIISTKNEACRIGFCLASIINQDFCHERIEVIVVDNNSTDSTKEIAARYGAKICNFGPERSAQRNFGIKQAHGEYILYLDADMQLSKTVIKDCVKKCQEEDLIALYIPEKIKGRGFWIKVRDFERSFYNTTCIDAVRFIRRDAFLNAGGFDERFNEGEDWDLDRRIKQFGNTDIIESPLYHNEGRFSLSNYLKKKAFYAKNISSYIRKWGENDLIINKQVGLRYRYFGVFFENGKFKKLLLHPVLTLSMYWLKFCVGIIYIFKGEKQMPQDLPHYYNLEVPYLLQKYLAASQGKSFCDLGCGDGALLYALNESGYLLNKEVFAVDSSKKRIDIVKQINPVFKCFNDDVCNIRDLGAQSIDFIVSTQVIEHVPDDECMVREIKRILKSYSIVYLTTVFKKRYAWYFYRNNRKWVIDPTHVREYMDVKPLLQLFQKYGFEKLEEKKTLLWFPVLDFFLKRMGLCRKIYLNKIFHMLRQIKIPIFGYYSWELVFRN
ncbi:MAG: hypothetical protein AUJ74_06260 [Candidatus Omnitrophica bacterium CG1_02_44_16]|nr:MAG: hypothetical protein AUJ74_06260 [Candidatus Omnitrophica bacterium CG1_02_44_16]